MALKEGVVSGHTPPREVEEDLIALATKGDVEAFTRLYDVYADRVLRYIYGRVGRIEDAEDLTQMAFLQAWRAIGRYRSTETPFRGWLFRIAHNVVVSYFRSWKPVGCLQDDLVDPGESASPDGVLAGYEQQQQIRQAILRLSPDQRRVVTMRFLEDFDYQEIAGVIGKSEGTVRVIQCRALQQLRKLLERERLDGAA